jgi:acyl carrier protein
MESKRLTETVFAVIEQQVPSFDRTLSLNTPLGPEGLGLDSLAILEVVLELERRTGISLRDENLTAEALSTPASLILCLEQSLLH